MNPSTSTPTDNAVTIHTILAKVKDVQYTILSDMRTTICQVTLENGYTVLGSSSVVDPANFDAAKGQHFAWEDALEKIWPLEGYLLTELRYLRSKMQFAADTEKVLTQ